MPSSPPPLTLESSLYLFHHVFLPPKLPQSNDYSAQHELLLLDRVKDALCDFSSNAQSRDVAIITTALSMMRVLRAILGSEGEVNEEALRKALQNLDVEGGILPIYVRDQNAGILLTRTGNAINVESFELSPRNGDVMATVGRLQRVFPGPTLALVQSTFSEPRFQQAISQTVSRMSNQSVAGTKLKVKKAGQMHDEDRDTTHPKMVTEFIMAILRPRCTDVDVLQIQKNTREEVLWNDCRSPWRRSALWLLTRVVLQLVFQRERRSDDLYKGFMVFFMASLVQTAPPDLPSEMLYLMTLKIARRLIKLDLSDEPPWLKFVDVIVTQANDRVRDMWQEVMKSSNRPSKRPLENLDFGEDIFCTLPALDGYLRKIQQRTHEHSPVSQNYQPTKKLQRHISTVLPVDLEFGDTGFQIYNLAAMEDWVAVNLEYWLESNRTEENTCGRLADLMTAYHKAASSQYSKNPEALSVIVLTLLELWIACDKSAIYFHPLLREYDPFVPRDIFQSLLLPFQSQMDRLSRAEEYLKQREAALEYKGNFLFRDFGTESCFSVRYFDQSPCHQELFQTIREHANRKRSEKESEFKRKQQEYNELKDLVNRTECEYDAVSDLQSDIGESRHSSSCLRCKYEAEANGIEISIHEWPLPTNELEAKSTVFELNVPRPFGCWRDATVVFLSKILGYGYSRKQSPRARYTLERYRGLSSFYVTFKHSQCIGLLSEDKPHEATHRKIKLLTNVTIDDICLPNGLSFRYFDNALGCFVAWFQRTAKVANMCTYQLPQQSSSLQQFLRRPAEGLSGPSPNSAISSQFNAPKNMSLGEYKSLASMPLGWKVQWQNVLLELSTSAVDFKKVETVIFILQVINEAGPPQSHTGPRIGHIILSDEKFAATILTRIDQAKEEIKENWALTHGMCALIFLVSRVLSLSPSSDIRRLCTHHLIELRHIVFRWATLVREDMNQTADDTQKMNMIGRSFQLALVCAETFNVESLPEVFATPSDISIYIQCCMMIHDMKNASSMESGSLLSILYHRWQSLSYRSHPILTAKVLDQGDPGLDMAFKEVWVAYDRRTSWSRVWPEVDYWLTTRNEPQSFQGTGMLIHYNLLSGELLVNGIPLARLPSEYERHQTYQTLFGRSPLDVMPSDIPAMQFCCRNPYMEHTVHLGFNNTDLLVRSEKEHHVWEFIPPRLLDGCFPDAFFENYTHWYAVDHGCVEFRPVKNPWISSQFNWRLRRSSSHGQWFLEKQGTYLISQESETAKLISKIFEPIEKESKVHCIFHRKAKGLDIHIPRLLLGFTLQPKGFNIQSRQYTPGFGLRNKIILVRADSQDRMILIPEGRVTWRKNGEHVDVNICWANETRLHAYWIDKELGRLGDNGSLQSKLFLAYLHAITSSYLPDPLLKKTGTEQALEILRSASIRSFARLAAENVKILENIASITPERSYYPANERLMQQVSWQPDLGSLSQHEGFYEEVKAIIDQDRRMSMFYPGKEPPRISLPHVEGTLLTRSKLRTSSFRVSGFGADDHTDEFDSRYSGLDRIRKTAQGSRVFTLCKMIYDEICCVQNLDSETRLSHLWKFISQADHVNGPNFRIDAKKMVYDASLILQPEDWIARNWCSVHQLLCTRGPQLDKFKFMIWMATMGFSEKANLVVLETVALIYLNPGAASVSPPPRTFFRPPMGYELDREKLTSLIQTAYCSRTPEWYLKREAYESRKQLEARKRNMLSANRQLVCGRLIRHLEDQWRSNSLTAPVPGTDPRVNDYVDVRSLLVSVGQCFGLWRGNRELRQYLSNVVALFEGDMARSIELAHYPCPRHVGSVQRKVRFVRFEDLLAFSPEFDMVHPELQTFARSVSRKQAPTHDMADLVEKLRLQAKSSYEKWYVDQLNSSVASLQKAKGTLDVELVTQTVEGNITEYVSRCHDYAERIYAVIVSQIPCPGMTARGVGPKEFSRAKVLALLAAVDYWPRVSPILLLQQLSRNHWHRLPTGWKRALITYGCSLTTLQRAKRLTSLINKPDELLKELKNPGHTNWDPLDYPESLLVEIENGILIRDVQEDIAKQMRQETGENVVMQLNMGEGKSSVIVPIVAAALANGSCLVRVLVAKPQSRQMFQMLASKLGGLLGRRVYHMPVSRSLKFDQAEADEIEKMCRECMKQGGVLLVQPEHILSLKLMCIECFITEKVTVGQSLMRILQLFQKSSRDVVDESDENFNVKFELIYTMGTQSAIELSPQRWMLIHQLLGLVRTYASDVKEELPGSIQLDEQKSGGFPRLRLLYRDAEKMLISRIATHICDYGIDSLQIFRQSPAVRKAVYTYITKSELSSEEIAGVENNSSAGFWTESTKGPLLLLRGLLAGGVLPFCFSHKRWRVNYGLDPNRDPSTKLCVPYRAKDNPSLRSEFSHPDVVLILTSLNYYYAGLDDADLFLAFYHLVKSDQANVEYQAWVSDAPALSNAYRQLVGVNLEDRQQCLDCIFPALRFSKPAIDYFLAQIVFPKEVKEFPDKLSASGWDIGEVKANPTVGFSGTNDSRKTLPLSVQQLDLPEQNHTNALVLEYLLRPENSVISIPDRDELSKSDAESLLDLVSSLNPPTQVILDVGAQILELSNLEVAKNWLERLPKDGPIQGIVFVNDNDEIVVLDRNHRVEPLQISPFSRQMEACFVFLDEAHTRGIDLKLPPDYRAAVTLGPGISKDKLVQACMRMRKLGNGQSVVFCVPRDIRLKIMALCGKTSTAEINVSDVLCWAASETWIEIQRDISLWAVQGRRFERQSRIWRDVHARSWSDMRISDAQKFLEPECRSLEYRYRPGNEENEIMHDASGDSDTLQLIENRCREFELDSHTAALSGLQEEQERELSPEIEREREVQRPPPATPEQHNVHPDLHAFVATGRIKTNSKAYGPAFQTLSNTSAASLLDLSQFPTSLLVTKDFATTIKQVSGSRSTGDAFQRPVRFILTSDKRELSTGRRAVTNMIIISPFEAQSVIGHVNQSNWSTLHLYTPRQNQKFLSLDRLDLYNVSKSPGEIEVPETLRIMLNLFAGQLYLESYSEYQRLCEFLGVASVKTRTGLVVAPDGFILEGGDPSKTPFRVSPLKFLKVLLSEIRKDCQHIDRTHLGKIVDGRLLHPSDFEDSLA
ncbi:hypothetical protein P170DRAFT_473334 [Aspergillus steynii IBT 23096]|uniref:ubiquitinyl hydrolase 1 n=1 Tax=Aspergillus steynii IBT 23096 TaxID=1392250 RepID=A0A2I2GKR8_9EURO|nr:uncharacterized protein P170DRAFT_473334 [Aspergillus steynii IBT 23096]PLB53474.1 hypothetical protein P170DRAFT_473334 [Aspergillus steynii IBT 23096]